MPNYSPRVNPNSIEVNPADKLEVDEAGWSKLEERLTKPIPEEARRHLLDLCNQYLAETKIALEAASLREVHQILTKLVTSPGISGLANEDAYRRVFQQLSTIQVTVDQEQPRGPRLGDVDYEFQRPFIVYLAPATAMSVFLNLRSAVAAAIADVENDLAGPTSTFLPPNAFPRFIRQALDWAAAFDLPTSTHNRESTARPFAEFMFALYRKFPKHLQRPRITSSLAFQKRINNAKPSTTGT